MGRQKKADDPSIILWVDENPPSGQWSPTMLYCLVEEGFEGTGPCKLGIAMRPEKRIASLQGGNWRKLKFVWQIEVLSREKAIEVEQHLLRQMRPGLYAVASRERLQSEWVDFPPNKAFERANDFLNALNERPLRRVA